MVAVDLPSFGALQVGEVRFLREQIRSVRQRVAVDDEHPDAAQRCRRFDGLAEAELIGAAEVVQEHEVALPHIRQRARQWHREREGLVDRAAGGRGRCPICGGGCPCLGRAPQSDRAAGGRDRSPICGGGCPCLGLKPALFSMVRQAPAWRRRTRRRRQPRVACRSRLTRTCVWPLRCFGLTRWLQRTAETTDA
jgi:hypothetical protein